MSKISVGNYESYDTKNNVLRIANCRGKKPVVTEIKKSIKILEALLIEINPCDAKDLLNDSITNLKLIVKENIF